MKKFEFTDKFVNRHIGPNETEIQQMLDDIGVSGLEELISKTIPSNIRTERKINLPQPVSEFEILNELKQIAGKNKMYKNYIGMGFYETITPAVILRNILENPGWYTQYTPYQAEIS